MVAPQSCIKEVSDAHILLGATFVVRGFVAWECRETQGRWQSLLAHSPGTCLLSLKAPMPPIWIEQAMDFDVAASSSWPKL